MGVERVELIAIVIRPEDLSLEPRCKTRKTADCAALGVDHGLRTGFQGRFED